MTFSHVDFDNYYAVLVDFVLLCWISWISIFSHVDFVDFVVFVDFVDFDN